MIRERLTKALTPRLTKYVPHFPTLKQRAFLLLTCKEALYGGAAGGGKSDALLMAALQYTDQPNYSALLLRRTYKDLTLPGAIMNRAESWLQGSDAYWNNDEKTWYFPSGATLTFGYLEAEKDKYRYQSAEFQFVGFDELTQFSETQYRYLFSRLRRLKGSAIPIRMRAATNPGGEGGPWVYQRFLIEGKSKGRVFIPANLQDNPHLDQEAYVESLSELDPVTREQLLKGDWEIREAGNKFKRQWFKFVKDYPKGGQYTRFWDLAATEPEPGKDPDWTVGVLMTEDAGRYIVCDVARMRGTPKATEDFIRNTTALDRLKYGYRVETYIEQESGASGKTLIDHFCRVVLKGYSVRGLRPTKDKEFRANPVSSAAEAGNIYVLEAPWTVDYLEELELFPRGPHDDQVDATSGAFEKLNKPKTKKKAKSLNWSGVINDEED